MTTEPRLHSIGQIVAGTFIGGPLAGAWLIARNYRALGEPAQARGALIWGVVATAAMVALVVILPEGTPNGVIPVAYSLVMGQIAHKLQGPRIKAHLEAGGRKGSGWLTVGIGAACLVVFFVVAMAAFLAMPLERLVYGDCDVYWENGATEDQARSVGDYMVEIGVFAPEHALDITVSQPGEELRLAFTLAEGRWDDPDTVSSFRNIAAWVSQDLIAGDPVQVLLCDDWGTPKRALHSDDLELVAPGSSGADQGAPITR
jgi:hypothetical protein